MRMIVTVTLAAALIIGAALPAAAQQGTFRGFATGGVVSESNNEQILTFGGGVLADLGQPWVSAGAQGDVLTSGGYFAGRGAVFAQVNPLGRNPIRPFIMGGVGFGVVPGPLLIGAGLDVLPANRRLGFRLSVEDSIAKYSIYDRQSFEPVGREIHHQLSFKLGVLF